MVHIALKCCPLATRTALGVFSLARQRARLYEGGSLTLASHRTYVYPFRTAYIHTTLASWGIFYAMPLMPSTTTTTIPCPPELLVSASNRVAHVRSERTPLTTMITPLPIKLSVLHARTRQRGRSLLARCDCSRLCPVFVRRTGRSWAEIYSATSERPTVNRSQHTRTVRPRVHSLCLVLVERLARWLAQLACLARLGHPGVVEPVARLAERRGSSASEHASGRATLTGGWSSYPSGRAGTGGIACGCG